MKLQVQTFIVKVVTADPNPASTAARIEGAIVARDRWGDIALTAEAVLASNDDAAREMTIPNPPNNSPRAYDDWFNNFVIPALKV